MKLIKYKEYSGTEYHLIHVPKKIADDFKDEKLQAFNSGTFFGFTISGGSVI